MASRHSGGGREVMVGPVWDLCIHLWIVVFATSRTSAMARMEKPQVLSLLAYWHTRCGCIKVNKGKVLDCPVFRKQSVTGKDTPPANRSVLPERGLVAFAVVHRSHGSHGS